jgi:proline dehydrogenase
MGILDKAIAESVPLIPRPIVRRISGRYIAGSTLREAIPVIRDLNEQGCAATVDVLGESTTSEAQVVATVKEYKQVLDAIVENGLDSGVSIKPTAFGLNLDEELCRTTMEEIITYAAERDRFVRIDMEDSPYTSATIELVLDFYERHANTGAVIQAYLRRSVKDVERLAEAGVSVRLCKGIYDEPRRIAYKNFDVVRANYVLLLETFLRAGCYVGVATHDEYLVWHALRLVRELDLPRDRYEFQMLLGVDEPLRRILVEAGHQMRVYVPYGEDWYAYSTRRLQENPKIAGYVARDVIEAVADAMRR